VGHYHDGWILAFSPVGKTLSLRVVKAEKEFRSLQANEGFSKENTETMSFVWSEDVSKGRRQLVGKVVGEIKK